MTTTTSTTTKLLTNQLESLLEMNSNLLYNNNSNNSNNNNNNNSSNVINNVNNNEGIKKEINYSNLKRNRSNETFNEAGNFTLEKQIRRESFNFPVHTYTGISIAGSRGGDRPNQDNMFMFEDRETRTLVLGCLDGHGEFGHQISTFFKNGIEERLFRHPLMSINPSRATEEVIKRLEFEARCRRDMDTRFSGTTLAMVIIQETRVISINIGDSRVVLGTRDETGQLVARPLSRDHKPDDINELTRIIQLGGRVYRTISSQSSSSSLSSTTPSLLSSPGSSIPSKSHKKKLWGPVRVWLKDMDAPGLAMSRSLCDDIIHTAGVVSTLEFYEHTFNHLNDCVLIVGTDGMWQYVSNQEAVEMAVKAREPSKASVSLVKEGRKRYLQKEKAIDDTTVCIAFLRGIELHE